MSLDPKIYIVPVGHGMAAIVNDGEHVIIVDFGVDKYSCLQNSNCTQRINKVLISSVQMINKSRRRIAILTHLDMDHFNILAALLNKFGTTLDELYLPMPPKVPVEPREAIIRCMALIDIIADIKKLPLGSALKTLGERSIEVKFVSRGMRIYLAPRVQMSVLWPPIEFPIPKRYKRKYDELLRRTRKVAEDLINLCEKMAKEMEIVDKFHEKAKIYTVLIQKGSFEFREEEPWERGEGNAKDLLSIVREVSPIDILYKVNPILAEDIVGKAKRLTNTFSMVAGLNTYPDTYRYTFCPLYWLSTTIFTVLLTGNVEPQVQDLLYVLEKPKLRPGLPHAYLLQVPHHGTYLGKYVKHCISKIAWIPLCDSCKYMKKRAMIRKAHCNIKKLNTLWYVWNDNTIIEQIPPP